MLSSSLLAILHAAFRRMSAWKTQAPSCNARCNMAHLSFPLASCGSKVDRDPAFDVACDSKILLRLYHCHCFNSKVLVACFRCWATIRCPRAPRGCRRPCRRRWTAGAPTPAEPQHCWRKPQRPRNGRLAPQLCRHLCAPTRWELVVCLSRAMQTLKGNPLCALQD